MRNLNISRAVSLVAASGVLAVPAVASAETVPTQAQVDQTLTQDYLDITAPLDKKYTLPVSPSHIGNLAVTINTASLEINGSLDTGTSVRVQIDAFNKRSHTLQESIINVITPRDIAALPVPAFVQVALFRTRYIHKSAPQTPAGFNRVMASTSTTPSEYDFNLGNLDGSWQLSASHSQGRNQEEIFSENPEPNATGTISLNFDATKALITQGERVLKAIERDRVLPPGQPANLMPNHLDKL